MKTKTNKIDGTLNAEDSKQVVNDGFIEKLVEKKVKEVDFSTKMQLDFQKIIKTTDPLITTMQSDVRDVSTKANTNKGSITKIEQQLGVLSSQINSFTPITNQHPSPAPPPVPLFLPSQLPGIPTIPNPSENLSSHQRMSPSSSSVRSNVDQ